MLDRIDRRGFLAALGSSVVATATGCLQGENRAEHEGWPMYGYDAGNTWYKPNTSGPKEEVSVDWADALSYGSGGGEIPSPPGSIPAVADGVVYVGSLGKRSLLAYDAETGEELWRFEMGYGVRSSPAVMDGRVYIDRNENLYALDVETGDLLWEVELDAGSVGPKVYDGKVFVIGKKTHAIDAETGEKLWNSEYGAYDGGAVADGEVYVGREDLRSLNAETGEEKWSAELDEGLLIFGQTVADGLLYTGSSENTVYAVNTDNGEVVWKVDDFTAHALYSVFAYPTVDEKRVYFAEAPRSVGERRLHAMDKETGEEIWSYEDIDDTPAIVDGVVYLHRGIYLVALDAETGDEMWVSRPLRRIDTSPVVVDGHIYAGGNFSNIVAYSTDS